MRAFPATLNSRPGTKSTSATEARTLDLMRRISNFPGFKSQVRVSVADVDFVPGLEFRVAGNALTTERIQYSPPNAYFRGEIKIVRGEQKSEGAVRFGHEI